ncbi:hypothetical protein [Anatilimnocola floriformis]|uniref:hypothetical protein n=1 Tax=Anatilimnocola floriformis TaxID=2948575 RepID=UPI0020C54CF0|nr:hypothetical protein [Anatilimnocola floriformis]
MGTDIHMYAEFEEENGAYQAIADGEFWMPRDYDLFAALAGVRGREKIPPKFPQRGIPANVSADTASHFYLPVMSAERAAAWGVVEYFTPEEARELEAQQRASWLPEGTTIPWIASPEGHLTNPGRHSPSWLTAAEVVEALSHAKYPLAQCPRELRLLLEYLQKYTAETNRIARIVFWFDS